jgi:hypothetical protein
MRDKIWILLFLLVACQAKNKEDIQKYNEKINFVKEGKQKVENKSYSAKNYINLEKFNSEYSYWDMINEYLKISSINTKNRELEKYIRLKEKKMKNYKIGSELQEFKNLTQEEKVIQMMKLLIEMRKKEIPLLLADNEYTNNMLLSIFGNYIEKYKEEIHPKEKLMYQILEKNFNIKDIEIVLRYLTYNLEFGNYEIDKKYNLTNVDNILDKLSKIEGISEEEWLAREGNQNNKVFENEVDSILGFIYLLKNNKILITGKNNKILKEIKITDYKNTDMAIYKGIFYIYDNGEIYEYLLKNLNEVKRYDIN